MEFFRRAKVFRLKSSHKDKYLVADDEDTVKQSRDMESTKAHWAFELVEGKSNVIRLRSCHTHKYLACLQEKFLTGWTGSKVAQRLRLDSTVEWVPVKEGPYVKLKSHVGTLLRANPTPWKNLVTNDRPDHWTGNQEMFTWIVDIVKLVDNRVDIDSGPNVVHVPNGVRMPEIEEDDENSDSSESFGKLKAMLAALDDS